MTARTPRRGHHSRMISSASTNTSIAMFQKSRFSICTRTNISSRDSRQDRYAVMLSAQLCAGRTRCDPRLDLDLIELLLSNNSMMFGLAIIAVFI